MSSVESWVLRWRGYLLTEKHSRKCWIRLRREACTTVCFAQFTEAMLMIEPFLLTRISKLAWQSFIGASLLQPSFACSLIVSSSLGCVLTAGVLLVLKNSTFLKIVADIKSFYFNLGTKILKIGRLVLMGVRCSSASVRGISQRQVGVLFLSGEDGCFFIQKI